MSREWSNAQPLITLADASTLKLGAQVKVAFARNLKGLTKPEGIKHEKESERRTSIRGRCLFGILEQPQEGKPKLWGVFSWDLTAKPLRDDPSLIIDNPRVIRHHTYLLEKHEPPKDISPWTIRWFMDCGVGSLWRGLSHAKTEMILSKRVMSAMFDFYGDPEEEAQWIAQRFLPKRVPGSVRLVDPTHIQFFIAL